MRKLRASVSQWNEGPQENDAIFLKLALLIPAAECCLHIKSFLRGSNRFILNSLNHQNPLSRTGIHRPAVCVKNKHRGLYVQMGASSRKIPPGIHHEIYHSKHSGRIKTGIALHTWAASNLLRHMLLCDPWQTNAARLKETRSTEI